MATSSIPAAIDYLLTAVRAMPAFADPVAVCDGWPDRRADRGIAIGVTPADPETSAANVHAELGAQAQWETYDIPCVAWAYLGGGQEAMKATRDQVFAMLDALDSHLRTTVGRTLGGALKSAVAIVSSIDLVQTGTATEAGEGRSCELYFSIRCKSRSAA